MSDEHERSLGRAEGGICRLDREDVFPDGIAGASVVERDLASIRGRSERLEEDARLVGQRVARPPRCRSGLGVEVLDCHLPGAEHDQVVVADEREVSPLLRNGAALVGARAVPDGVAEVPDLVGSLLLQRCEHGFERM